jgi:hypothetical protein
MTYRTLSTALGVSLTSLLIHTWSWDALWHAALGFGCGLFVVWVGNRKRTPA